MLSKIKLKGLKMNNIKRFAFFAALVFFADRKLQKVGGKYLDASLKELLIFTIIICLPFELFIIEYVTGILIFANIALVCLAILVLFLVVLNSVYKNHYEPFLEELLQCEN